LANASRWRASLGTRPVRIWQPEFDVSFKNGGVTIIGYHGSQEAVVIPEVLDFLPVTGIGDGVFANTSISSVVIPASVTSVGDGFWLGPFLGCTNLTSVVIPHSVTNVASKAFTYCTGLTNVVIGNGVKTIGEEAFGECERLANITFGSSVTVIGPEA